jgi:hypothetical protein
MNTFTYIGILILLVGWIGLIIIALSYKFEDDEYGKLHPRSLPKTNPDNPSKTGTPP